MCKNGTHNANPSSLFILFIGIDHKHFPDSDDIRRRAVVNIKFPSGPPQKYFVHPLQQLALNIVDIM